MANEANAYGYLPRAAAFARVRSLWRHMRRLEHEGHHSALHQMWELVRLRTRRGVGPFLYLSAGLYRRELSWREKLEYVGGSRYDRLIHAVNPIEYDHLARNKLETWKILTAHGVPTPPVYGVVAGESGWTWDGDVLHSPDDLVALLRNIGTDRVCFKYVTGTRGRGFFRVTIDADAKTVRIEPNGGVEPLADFWETLRREKLFSGYFCQGVIEQHPELVRLNPACVNTARTWMVRTANGGWEMDRAVLRIGMGDAAVDNVSRGGIAAAVDLASGRLSAAGDASIERRPYPRHPHNGGQIEGTVLPAWAEAVALCKRTADLFPFYCLLAVDIAFTPGGPIVVEIGTTPDQMQEFGRGAYPLLSQLHKRGRVGGAP